LKITKINGLLDYARWPFDQIFVILDDKIAYKKTVQNQHIWVFHVWAFYGFALCMGLQRNVKQKEKRRKKQKCSFRENFISNSDLRRENLWSLSRVQPPPINDGVPQNFNSKTYKTYLVSMWCFISNYSITYSLNLRACDSFVNFCCLYYFFKNLSCSCILCEVQ